jgi:hypothetical protein
MASFASVHETNPETLIATEPAMLAESFASAQETVPLTGNDPASEPVSIAVSLASAHPIDASTRIVASAAQVSLVSDQAAFPTTPLPTTPETAAVSLLSDQLAAPVTAVTPTLSATVVGEPVAMPST